MEARMRGTFPGGPRKSIPAADRTAPARLRRVEQIEERASVRSARRGSKKRQKRVVVGVFSAFVLSGGLGLFLGMRSHTSPDELREAAEKAANPSVDELGETLNKAMLELWRMEDVEYQRNSR